MRLFLLRNPRQFPIPPFFFPCGLFVPLKPLSVSAPVPSPRNLAYLFFSFHLFLGPRLNLSGLALAPKSLFLPSRLQWLRLVLWCFFGAAGKLLVIFQGLDILQTIYTVPQASRWTQTSIPFLAVLSFSQYSHVLAGGSFYDLPNFLCNWTAPTSCPLSPPPPHRLPISPFRSTPPSIPSTCNEQ